MLDIADKISDIFLNLIKFLWTSFTEPFETLTSLKRLVFGRDKDGNDDLIWSTFRETDLSLALNPLYYTMLSIAGIFFVAFIVINGMRIVSSSYNAIRRNEMLEFSKDLILVALGFYYLPLIYDLLFTINDGIINIFSSQYNSALDEIDTELEKNGEGTGILGFIAVQLVLLGLMIWANFYYMMRKITLIILMSMGPLMLAFWLLPQFKSMTSAWLKELTGTIFVQSIHAFVFWTIAVLSKTSDNLIATVIVYVVFIPISESIRGLLGMGGNVNSNLSKAGSMFGMSALAGMAGAVKGALDGKSVMGALKGMKDGVKSNDQSITGDSESGNKVSSDNEKNFAASTAGKLLKAGDIGSKAGKAVFGAAGAVAGSGLGPVGSIMGAELGSKLGDLSGGVTGRLGSATAIGIANRIKAGRSALEELKNAQNTDLDISLAEAVAEQQANTWANDNQSSIMKDLQDRFPDASPQDIDKKFNDIKQQKMQESLASAGDLVKSAKQFAAGAGNGESLVNASSEAMSRKWAENNKEQFMKEYEAQQPRATGETESAYQERKNNAFQNRVAQVQEQFKNDGNKYLLDHAGADGNVSRIELARFMGASASEHKGIGNVTNLEDAARDGMEHVQGVQLFNKAGKPNMNAIANSLAAAQTLKDKQAFITAQTSGENPAMTMQQAEFAWSQQERSVHSNNIDAFGASSLVNRLETIQVKPISSSTTGVMLQNTGAFIGGAMGLKQIKQTLGNISDSATIGVHTFQESLQNGQVLQSVPNAIQAANQTMANNHILQNSGDAVLSHKQVMDAAGLAGALVLGRTGLRLAQGIASRTSSPYTQAVQEQIASPSEVMSMAQTVIDDNGNTQIAQGAIRQVITRDASYVEVRTNSGEIRTVSRIGAGNERLKQGETVYQDLAVEGDAIVPAKGSKSQPSTYRLDSGGGRIPTAIEVNSSPSSLLGNPSVSNHHAPVQQQHAPVFNQRVDAGQFYTEDIRDGNFQNVELVIDKGRQFVAGEKDGVKYRLSPIMQGDARMKSNSVASIPLEIEAGQLKPVQSNSQYGLNGTVMRMETEVQTIVNQQINVGSQNGTRTMKRQVQAPIKVQSQNDETMYSQSFNNAVEDALVYLVHSRNLERAERGVDRRKHLDIVRRKQGVLG